MRGMEALWVYQSRTAYPGEDLINPMPLTRPQAERILSRYHEGKEGCMAGGIYTEEKCRVCGGPMIDNHRNAVACPVHQGEHAHRIYVRFGRQHRHRFTAYPMAMKWLNHLRHEKDEREDLFDIQDYGIRRPKSFKALAPQYLKDKEEKGRKSFRKIRGIIERAAEYFGNTNLRDIDDNAIEAYLSSLGVGAKTRRNHQTQLQNLWNWSRRKKALTLTEMPVFDPIEYKLGYRKTTTWEIQRKVIEKVKDISYVNNPRVWLAIDLLATYTELRPDDLRRIREGDYRDGFVTIFDPTKSENKNQPWITIKLLDEHRAAWEEIRDKYPALPDMPFFRHHKGRAYAKPGDVFSDKYLPRWWNKAAKAIGLEGVSLYPGTRHTTVTETARMLGSEEAKKASGHRTNKAFERYNQAINDGAFQVVSKIRGKMKGEVVPLKKAALNSHSQGDHRGTTETTRGTTDNVPK